MTECIPSLEGMCYKKYIYKKSIQTLNICSKQKASGGTDAFFVKQSICSIPGHGISLIPKPAEQRFPNKSPDKFFH